MNSQQMSLAYTLYFFVIVYFQNRKELYK